MPDVLGVRGERHGEVLAASLPPCGVADVAGLAAAAAATTVMEPMSTESALSMESVARGGVLLPRSEAEHQLTHLLK